MSDLLYVARPIDRADTDNEFLVDATDALYKHHQNAQFGLYEPFAAFTVFGPPEPYVRRINNTALLFSDAVFAIWPHDAKSWGVPAEVERAVMLDKPVLILTNGPATWSMIDEKIEVFPFKSGDIDEAVRHSIQWLRRKVDEKKAEN